MNGRSDSMLNREWIETLEQQPQIIQWFAAPHTPEAFQKTQTLLDELLAYTEYQETHALMPVIETLSMLVEAYEKQHLPPSKATGIDALRELMQEHHLTQQDLAELGGQATVSLILNGKRKLNLRQIQLLAQRFGVSPEVFMD